MRIRLKPNSFLILHLNEIFSVFSFGQQKSLPHRYAWETMHIITKKRVSCPFEKK